MSVAVLTELTGYKNGWSQFYGGEIVIVFWSHKIDFGMLTILLLWIYVSTLCWVGGWFFMRFAQLATGAGCSVLPLSLHPFLGLAWIASCTALISLCSPVRWWWNIAFVVVIAAGVVRGRRHLLAQLRELSVQIKRSPEITAIFFLAGAILLLKSASVVHAYGTADAVFHSDTGYYHAPSIRWIEEYGIVPGLGNLLPPLAIDYLWFQPCALFGFRDFLPQRLHALTGLVILWALAFSIGGVWRLFNSGEGNRIRYSDLYRTLLLLPLSEAGNYIVSDSGDEPAAVMLLIAIGAALIFLENANASTYGGTQQESPVDLCALLLLICFAVGIKLSALPLLGLGVILIAPALRSGNFRLLSLGMMIVLVVIGGKIARSVILSGYPVYPLPQLDFFHVDWKMPAQVLVSEKNYVASMARARFAEPGRLLSGGMGGCIIPWIGAFLKTPVGIGAICSMASLILSGWFFRSVTVGHFRKFWKVHVTLIAGILYWFLMAPDVRFGYGFLTAWEILCISTGVMALGNAFKGHVRDCRLGNVSWALVLVAAFALIAAFTVPRKNPGDSFGKGMLFSNYYSRFLAEVATGVQDCRFLIFQDPYPPVDMKLFHLGDMPLWRVSTGMRCWDARLPSSPFLYRRIEPRGRDLSSGFRVCAGSTDDFSGMRLAREYQEALERQKLERVKASPKKTGSNAF